jgi:hypothetical protein
VARGIGEDGQRFGGVALKAPLKAAASQFALTALVKLELSPTCSSPKLRMQEVLYRDLSDLSANRH